MGGAFLFGPTAASGKGMPTTRRWNDPALARKRNLTTAEEAVLDQKFAEARPKMIQARGEMQALRSEMETALERDPLDEAGVMEHFRLLEQNRSRLIREGFTYILETRRLLGGERFRQLKAIHDQARAKRDRKEGPEEMLR